MNPATDGFFQPIEHCLSQMIQLLANCREAEGIMMFEGG
jgi:hypothetical protein